MLKIWIKRDTTQLTKQEEKFLREKKRTKKGELLAEIFGISFCTEEKLKRVKEAIGGNHV